MYHSKQIFITLLLTFFSLFVFAQKNVKYSINTEKSTLKWIGKKVAGEHSGKASFKSGEIQWDEHKFTNGTFIIDMTSIKTTDLEGELADKLDGHLKSKDFFGVKDNPTSQLTTTSGVQDKSDASLYHFKGDLTIKKITQPISFDAKVKKEDNKISVTTEFKIDRTLYNIRYGSGKFFDNLEDKIIYDEFTIVINAYLTD